MGFSHAWLALAPYVNADPTNPRTHPSRAGAEAGEGYAGVSGVYAG